MSKLDRIIALIAIETGVVDITEQTLIGDLVKDSLEFVQLMMEVREKIGDFPDELLSSINTVGDVARAIDGALC